MGLESIVDDGSTFLGWGTMGDQDTKSEKDWMTTERWSVALRPNEKRATT